MNSLSLFAPKKKEKKRIVCHSCFCILVHNVIDLLHQFCLVKTDHSLQLRGVFFLFLGSTLFLSFVSPSSYFSYSSYEESFLLNSLLSHPTFPYVLLSQCIWLNRFRWQAISPSRLPDSAPLMVSSYYCQCNKEQ